MGCWCSCLSGARCRQLYDLHINSMTTRYFLFQIISFNKYFYVSLRNNVLLFCGGSLLVEALGNCPVCPLLNPVLVYSSTPSCGSSATADTCLLFVEIQFRLQSDWNACRTTSSRLSWCSPWRFCQAPSVWRLSSPKRETSDSTTTRRTSQVSHHCKLIQCATVNVNRWKAVGSFITARRCASAYV